VKLLLLYVYSQNLVAMYMIRFASTVAHYLAKQMIELYMDLHETSRFDSCCTTRER
jgi:hypothetical protein